MYLFLYLILLVLALCAFDLMRTAFRRRNVAANIGGGTHTGSLTKRATAALAARHLLVTFGATADLIKINAVDDMPLGPTPDMPDEAGYPTAVHLLGVLPETVKMVGSEEITAGEEVYTAASGKVQDLPTANGTYWLVGRALTTCSGDGVEFEVQHCYPVKLVINN